MIPWAADKWFGEDKLTHACWCYAGAVTLRALGVPWLVAALVVCTAGWLVEHIQWTRKAAGYATFASLPSYRDLAWNTAGLVTGLIAYEVTF